VKRFILSLVIVTSVLGWTGCGSNNSPSQPASTPVQLINYPSTGTGGDGISRGFYVNPYPGSTLSKVVLYYVPNATGSYGVSLIAHQNTYDGPVIGGAVQAPTFADTITFIPVTFTFSGNPSAIKGSVVAFVQVQNSGPGSLFYDNVGTVSGGTTIVFETNGTAPPLDTPRNPGPAISLFGNN
jgi:hypothetical protein